MINIVVPMAGLGSRFSEAGYTTAKPFIPVNGQPMISLVLDNLKQKNCRFILITRNELAEVHKNELKDLRRAHSFEVVTVNGLTEGAVCTVLHARKYIQNDSPLLIANSDQLVDTDVSEMIRQAEARSLDGSIMTFRDPTKNPKWSFARVNNDDLVEEVKEKQAISEFATVGIYYFKQGLDFINSSIDMICKNERVNNEFYVCPVYNYLIKEKARIGIYNINQNQMHGLGTPADLESYLRLTQKAG